MGYLESSSSESVRDWLHDRTIFLTGGSGFIGRNLIIKLVREIHSVKNIYVLVRKSGDRSGPERFRKILEMEGLQENRIIVLEGDLVQENYGLDERTLQKLNEEVEIVFHVAALINFSCHLDKAVDINVRGTEKLLKMANNFRRLQVFVHVSTAYCQCQINEELKEKVYEGPRSPKEVLSMSANYLKTYQDELLQCWPNTYVWTKAVAEALVAEKQWSFPRVILRPSIVVPASKDPYFGWTVEHSLLTAAYIVWNMDIFRVLHLNHKSMADLIPVDVVSNACILSAYQHKNNKNKDILVINCTNNSNEPIFWTLYTKKTSNVRFVDNYYSYLVQNILCERIPLSLFFVIGPKLKKLYYLNQKLHNLVKYFAKRDWIFEKNNFKKLSENLNEEERFIYSLDMNDIDWFEIIKTSGDRIYTEKINTNNNFKTLLFVYHGWRPFIYALYLTSIYELFEYVKYLV